MSCSKCFTGYVHEGKTRGQETKAYGSPAYVASAPSDPPKGIIVLIPDAFGWRFVNMRLLADYFADQIDATVYIPEFQDGHPMNLKAMDLLERVTSPGNLWYTLTKIFYVPLVLWYLLPHLYHNTLGTISPRVSTFLSSLRAAHPNLPIGAIGYCWGGRYSIRATHAGPDGSPAPVDVAYAAHPSLLAVPAEIEAITRPVSFALGEIDPVVGPSARKEIKGILDGKKSEVEYDWELYEGANHGFAARGDNEDPKKKEQADRAAKQAVEWMKTHFERWKATAKL